MIFEDHIRTYNAARYIERAHKNWWVSA